MANPYSIVMKKKIIKAIQINRLFNKNGVHIVRCHCRVVKMTTYF